jgi:hypothetical protein
MTEIIVFLSGKGNNWAYVKKLVNEFEWDKVIIVTDEFRNEMLDLKSDAEIVTIDPALSLVDMANDLKDKLEGEIQGIEVALNFVSGRGKEHMALVSAVLKLGLAVRFIALKPGGIEEI